MGTDALCGVRRRGGDVFVGYVAGLHTQRLWTSNVVTQLSLLELDYLIVCNRETMY